MVKFGVLLIEYTSLFALLLVDIGLFLVWVMSNTMLFAIKHPFFFFLEDTYTFLCQAAKPKNEISGL